MQKFLKYPNYVNLPKKWIKTFKRSKISIFFSYFQNFWKKFVFQMTFVSLKSTKVCFYLLVCEKLPFELLKNYIYIPWTISRALLMLGKSNFHSLEPPFSAVYSRKIPQPLKSKWREIQISFASDFFVTCGGNLATIKHIK